MSHRCLSLPTIVIVPDAWHTASHWLPFTDSLHSRSFPTAILLALPTISSGPAKHSSHRTDLNTDIAAIRSELLLPLIERQCKDVLLVMHSYGAIAGACSVHGLSKRERKAKGLPGGVLGMLFMNGILVDVGKDLNWTLGVLPLWSRIKGEESSVSGIEGLIFAGLPIEEVRRWASKCGYQSQRAFKTKVAYTAWRDPWYRDKCVYLLCEDDEALPRAYQEHFAEVSSSRVERLRVGHSPYLTHREKALEVVERAVRQLMEV